MPLADLSKHGLGVGIEINSHHGCYVKVLDFVLLVVSCIYSMFTAIVLWRPTLNIQIEFLYIELNPKLFITNFMWDVLFTPWDITYKIFNIRFSLCLF